MPGVVYILTPQNSPKTYPMPTELFFQGEVVAIVAAETEDQAEDGVAAIEVEYKFSLRLATCSRPWLRTRRT